MPGKCSANGAVLYGICSSSNDRKVRCRWCCTVRCVPCSACTSTCRSSHGTVQHQKCRYFVCVQCRHMVGTRQRIWTTGVGQGGKETTSQVSAVLRENSAVNKTHFASTAQHSAIQCGAALCGAVRCTALTFRFPKKRQIKGT